MDRGYWMLLLSIPTAYSFGAANELFSASPVSTFIITIVTLIIITVIMGNMVNRKQPAIKTGQKEALDHSILLDRNKFFYVCDGTFLRSIKELTEALDHMDNKTFFTHVSETSNDFANWIRGVFANAELAHKIYLVKTREQLRAILKSEGY